MEYIILEIIQLFVGLFLILLANRKSNQKLVLLVSSLIMLLLFVKDLGLSYKYVDQAYFLNRKAIMQLNIKPFSNRHYTSTLDSTITIVNSEKILEVKNLITSAKTITTMQPNKLKSFIVEFVTNKNKKYSYLIEVTSNYGTLIHIIIEDGFYGTLSDDKIFKYLYESTGNHFFYEN